MRPSDAASSGLRVERRGDVALLVVDQPARPVNLLDTALLGALSQAVEELVADPGVIGAVLCSSRPGSFLAGADVSAFLDYASPAEVEAAIRQGNSLLDRIEGCGKPLVAAIDGACLGGGTELVMAMRYRLAGTGSGTRIGLPEVQLGLLPGLGGCVRLPERVGLAQAADMILSGRNLFPRQALRAGLVDALVHPEGLLAAAVAAAQGLASGKLKPRAVKRSVVWWALETRPGRELVLRQARSRALERTHGNYPAVDEILRSLTAVARGGRQAGFAESAAGFARLLFTSEARALIHLFFAQTAAKKNPFRGEALPVETVAVLGAGLMGSGIAEVSAAGGLRVLLKDRDPELALKGKASVYRGLSARVGKGRTAFERDQLVERVVPIDDYSKVSGARLTIEAVLEEPSLKRKVLSEVERATAGERHVFASNTSAIRIAEIAEGAVHPEAVIGMHYFSPVPKMPLLEIVVADRTADWATATAFYVGARQGKTTIVVNDGPGFYTTRVLSVYIAEAMRALDEGSDPHALEAAMVGYGFPLGPLALLDDVGIDVGAKIEKVLEPLMSLRGLARSRASAELVAAGYLGRKVGKGFYRYEGSRRAKELDAEALRIAGFRGGDRRGAEGATRSGADGAGAELAQRLALAFVREAVLCLEEGVLRSARDGDVGAVFGLGFPPFRGGPFFLIDREGAASVVARLSALAQRHGERFAPPRSLVELAESGGRFHGGA
ncbi:MAG: enoyl-CoA hydratase/isomerase family protein [Trueperaceae bacterium]|nr:enoyl-CoA hydratase/isomerase family protein [Trueperaceae bacterium]MCW5818675.1 enoyl-CoA hydratase/isomerase family protein [Trueperaceae bacterium]